MQPLQKYDMLVAAIAWVSRVFYEPLETTARCSCSLVLTTLMGKQTCRLHRRLPLEVRPNMQEEEAEEEQGEEGGGRRRKKKNTNKRREQEEELERPKTIVRNKNNNKNRNKHKNTNSNINNATATVTATKSSTIATTAATKQQWQ